MERNTLKTMKFNFEKYHPITGFTLHERIPTELEIIKTKQIKAERLKKKKERKRLKEIEQAKEKEMLRLKKKQEKSKFYEKESTECIRKKNIKKMIQHQSKK